MRTIPAKTRKGTPLSNVLKFYIFPENITCKNITCKNITCKNITCKNITCKNITCKNIAWTLPEDVAKHN
jgi:hypothetical protein